MEMEWEGNAAAASAGRCEASRDVVIVLPAGSAAVRHGRQQEHQYQQRQRERELEQQQHPGAGFSGPGFAQPPEKVYYKTRLCEKFEAGKCAYQDGCTFAHGYEELRPPLPVPPSFIHRRSPLPLPLPPPPRPPSPTASVDVPYGGYHVRVCFEFRDTGACHRGDRCVYSHASASEMPFPGGPRSVEHALKKYSPGGVHRSSGGGYAPAAARSLPSVPARAAGEDGRKVTRLELLSRKKMSGIYGDWPDQD